MKILVKFLGLFLGIVSVILFQLFEQMPGVLESFYTNGFYRMIRFVYSITLTYIPFPLLYIFIILIAYLLVRRLFFKKRKGLLISLVNFLGYLLFVFYWSWGFNYARTDFDKRVTLELYEPDSLLLYDELLEIDSILLEIRKELGNTDSIPVSEDLSPENLQDKIRSSQVSVLGFFKEPIFRDPRIRELRPKGSLLVLKTAGVYFPFVFEGHIDDGLHSIEKPYVMAHEMAHAYGLTDEGVCNFIGFMTCVNAEDPFIKYSGWLEYQGYLYRALRRNYPDLLKEKKYKLPEAVVTDLQDIRKRLDKYPNIAPKIRDLFYNNYLKAQGVSDGMKSYSQITRLSYSFKQKYGDFIIPD